MNINNIVNQFVRLSENVHIIPDQTVHNDLCVSFFTLNVEDRTEYLY